MTLYEQLHQNGYTFSPVLDGNIHRFKKDGSCRKKTAWFVGWENFTKKGEKYEVAIYGDWKTGEKHEYKDETKKLSKQEQKEVRKQIQNHQQNLEAERERLRQEAADNCKATWEIAQEGTDSEYFKRKKISKPYGTKTVMVEDGDAVLVPTRDIKGKLWGFQKIMPDGSKIFVENQKISECFHSIGDLKNANTIYITEGFATGASISSVINSQCAVVVCFSANNLVSVARLLKKKFQQAAFVVCGDDDQFTEINEQPYNTGRIKAEEAAKACTGKAIFPKFASLDSKPTDFNDLHVLEGLNTLKDQILGVEPEVGDYIIPLGHIDNKYYYISSDQKSIICYGSSSHTADNLLGLMPLEYWETQYPGATDRTPVDWMAAKSDLMTKCRRRGLYKISNSRGCGAWKEKNGLVLNLGDSLWYEGSIKPFRSFKTKYIYESSGNNYLIPGEDILTVSESMDFLNLLSKLSWERGNSFMFLGGWLGLAPFCGAIEWRPHLWITGSRGTGKSTIMDDIVGPLISGYSKRFEGDTTEAGIRQTIGTDALPVLFDELETERDPRRVQSIIKLFRSASSHNSGPVIKGSAGGEAKEFNTRFAAIVSSINVNLAQQQDESRFTVASLKKDVNSYEQFRQIQKDISGMITDDFAQRFFNRSIALYDVYCANYAVLLETIAKRHDARTGQQYGALLAGYAILEQDHAVCPDQAEYYVDMAKIGEVRDEMTEDVEVDCFNHLLNQTVRVNGPVSPAQDISVYMAIENCYDFGNPLHPTENKRPYEWRKSLSMWGVRCEDDGIYVANRHPKLKEVFKDTPWHDNMWQQHLAKIEGSLKNQPLHFTNVKSTKSVKIPVDAVLNILPK
jgi:putative DNA primase/helicase